MPIRSFLRFSMSGMRSLAALFQNFATGMGSAPLFARGDNQPLLAMHQRNLGDFFYGDKAHVVRRRRSDIDKGAQTIVLAEMAARLLVSSGAVFDFSHRIQSDKCGLLTVAPQPQ